MWRVLVFLFVSLIGALPVDAAITVNSATGACTTAAASITFSVTVNAGANTVMVAGAVARDDPSIGVVASITFNGSGIDGQVTGAGVTIGDRMRTEQWRDVAPTVTTANMVQTWASDMNALCGGAVVLDGVAQSGTVFRTANTQTGSAGTTAALSVESVAGDRVVDVISCWNPSCTGNEGTGQSSPPHVSVQTGGGSFGIDMSSKTAVGNPTAMTFTLTDGDWWAYVGVAFVPSPGVPIFQHHYQQMRRH